MQPCARRRLRTPGPSSWRCRGDSRARRGSRDSVLDSCRSPPPPRPLRPSRPRGAPGTCGRPGGTRVAVLGVPLGLGARVPCLGGGDGGSLGAGAMGRAGGGCPGLGVAPCTPRLPPQLGVGFRIGHVSRVSRAAPAVPPPGSSARHCPELQPGGAPLCVGGQGCSTCPGFTVDLGCGCSSTCPWRSATAGTRLCSCSGCQPSAGQGSGVTVSCRQHCGPGQVQVAAEMICGAM